MESLGVCIATRDFECTLCGRPFSRQTGDLILPADEVCDECLAAFGPLDEKDLWATIARRRANSKENRES
jgi:5-methylcytosine-specific restriction endonuclease McrA